MAVEGTQGNHSVPGFWTAGGLLAGALVGVRSGSKSRFLRALGGIVVGGSAAYAGAKLGQSLSARTPEKADSTVDLLTRGATWGAAAGAMLAVSRGRGLPAVGGSLAKGLGIGALAGGIAGQLIDSFPSEATTTHDIATGVGKEALNTLTTWLPIPAPTKHENWIPYRGAVTEIANDDERQGADAMGAVLGALRLAPRAADRAEDRARRPLLTDHTFSVKRSADVVELSFDADASGNDWGRKNSESAVVSVYLDGRYHSDVTVIEERDGRYAVNLGPLDKGKHTVELRSAKDLNRSDAKPADAWGAATRTLEGQEADIARHAPILEGRDLGAPGGAADAGYTDTPLLMSPSIRENPNGTRTITYGVLFSNEDGGTGAHDLYRTKGRASDWSPAAYVVTLDKRDRVVHELYEGPLHKVRTFDGEHDGKGRAVLRVATSNNMLSERVREAGTRWSAAPLKTGSGGGFDLMRRHPWTFAVTSKELLRQNKAEATLPRMPRQVDDPRQYIYLSGNSPLKQKLAAGEAVTITLRDGKTHQLKAERGTVDFHALALHLPGDVKGKDIASLGAEPGNALVLNDDFAARSFDKDGTIKDPPVVRPG